MTKYRIVETLIPLRKEPTHRSEMIDELLYGEEFTIFSLDGTWLEIKCENYDYRGWIDGSAKYSESTEFENSNKKVLCSRIGRIKTDWGEMELVAGSRISKESIVSGNFQKVVRTESGLSIVETAMQYLGSPYRWGGRSPFGIDCSGLVQLSCMLNGVSIPRDAHQQALGGEMISFLADALPGDLAFFGNNEDEITHTGILINSEKIIHSSGRVRIDTIDHEGIFNQEFQRYTHKLKVIKRIL
ncbi:MAG: hydrolase Nlp/P60 [Bacteroidetes bacterium HGW-Bacteroidetes-6]|jgi:hypothetical protein|nr:MAG: hydrolase Nlp/P60 [Bacteroidetes bacterium HGW-Bacteroidetes-6]